MAELLLKLYVAGSGTRAQAAIGHVRRLCGELLGVRAELQVVDLELPAGPGEGPRPIVAPTLVCEGPKGEARVFGDLSDARSVLASLGVEVAR